MSKEAKNKMKNVTKVMQNLQQNCKDQLGLFDKNKFMIVAGVLFGLNIEKNGLTWDFYKEINRCLYKILGKGHSLASCIQFIQGKKGQHILLSEKLKDQQYQQSPNLN